MSDLAEDIHNNNNNNGRVTYTHARKKATLSVEQYGNVMIHLLRNNHMFMPILIFSTKKVNWGGHFFSMSIHTITKMISESH